MMEFKRNTNREMLRGRDVAPFEWYTVKLNVFLLHVHNRTTSRKWTYKIESGMIEKRPLKVFDTKEQAMKACAQQALGMVTQDTIGLTAFIG